jgi:hypothetical protein
MTHQDEGHSYLTSKVQELLEKAAIPRGYIDEIIGLIVEAEYEREATKLVPPQR